MTDSVGLKESTEVVDSTISASFSSTCASAISATSTNTDTAPSTVPIDGNISVTDLKSSEPSISTVAIIDGVKEPECEIVGKYEQRTHKELVCLLYSEPNKIRKYILALQPCFGANLVAPPFDGKFEVPILEMALQVKPMSISISNKSVSIPCSYCALVNFPMKSTVSSSNLLTICKKCVEVGAASVVIVMPTPKNGSIFSSAYNFFMGDSNAGSRHMCEWDAFFSNENYQSNTDLPIPVLLISEKDRGNLFIKPKMKLNYSIEPYKKELLSNILRSALDMEFKEGSMETMATDDKHIENVLSFLQTKYRNFYDIDISSCCNLFISIKNDNGFYISLLLILYLNIFISDKEKISVRNINKTIAGTMYDLLKRITNGEWDKSKVVKHKKYLKQLIEFLQLLVKESYFELPTSKWYFDFHELLWICRYINYLCGTINDMTRLKGVVNHQYKTIGIGKFLTALQNEHKTHIFENYSHEVDTIINECEKQLKTFDELENLVSFAAIFDKDIVEVKVQFVLSKIQNSTLSSEIYDIYESSKCFISIEELNCMVRDQILKNFTPQEMYKCTKTNAYQVFIIPSIAEIKDQYITSKVATENMSLTSLECCLNLLEMLIDKFPDEEVKQTATKFFSFAMKDANTVHDVGRSNVQANHRRSKDIPFGWWSFFKVINHSTLDCLQKEFLTAAKAAMTFETNRNEKLSF